MFHIFEEFVTIRHFGLKCSGWGYSRFHFTSMCFQNVAFQHRFEEIYALIGRSDFTLLPQFHQTQPKSLFSFQTACEKEKRTRKERKNRSGTKITKLIINRSKEHKFIWHPEHQHAATFIEGAALGSLPPPFV